MRKRCKQMVALIVVLSMFLLIGCTSSNDIKDQSATYGDATVEMSETPQFDYAAASEEELVEWIKANPTDLEAAKAYAEVKGYVTNLTDAEAQCGKMQAIMQEEGAEVLETNNREDYIYLCTGDNKWWTYGQEIEIVSNADNNYTYSYDERGSLVSRKGEESSVDVTYNDADLTIVVHSKGMGDGKSYDDWDEKDYYVFDSEKAYSNAKIDENTICNCEITWEDGSVEQRRYFSSENGTYSAYEVVKTTQDGKLLEETDLDYDTHSILSYYKYSPDTGLIEELIWGDNLILVSDENGFMVSVTDNESGAMIIERTGLEENEDGSISISYKNYEENNTSILTYYPIQGIESETEENKVDNNIASYEYSYARYLCPGTYYHEYKDAEGNWLKSEEIFIDERGIASYVPGADYYINRYADRNGCIHSDIKYYYVQENEDKKVTTVNIISYNVIETDATLIFSDQSVSADDGLGQCYSAIYYY